MYSYAGSSAAATNLTPFTPPQQNTTSGSANQAAAVGQGTGSSAAGNAQSVVSSVQQSISAVPNALQSLATAAPAQATDPLGTLSNLISVFLDAPAALATFFGDIPLGAVGVTALPFDVVSALTGFHTDDIVSGWNGEEAFPGTGPAPVKPFPATLLNLPPGTVPPPSLSAGLGEANTVGALSVPPTWSIATPAVRPVAFTLPALPPASALPAAAGAVEEGSSLGSSSTLSEMALAGMAGRAMAGTVATGVAKSGKAPNRERAPTESRSKAKTVDGATGQNSEALQNPPRAVVTGVAAELREFAKLRDEGILTDEEYTEQKNRLLGR
jgi:PPE-repeat protein